MADYVMRLQNRDGSYIGEIPFYELQGEFRMNEPDEIRFKTSSANLKTYVDPVTQLKEGLTEVNLLRNGNSIFLGPIWDITVSSEAHVMTIMAQDVSSYLGQRYIMADTKFTKKRFAYAAWKLIQDTQALTYGDLGITLGQDAPTSPTGSFSFTKKSGTSILKALDKLSAGTTGFDWEINPSRQLMLYYPRIQIPSLITLEYPTVIKRYSVQGMGKYVANSVFAKGANKEISNVYSDATSQQLFGLRQYVASDSSIKSKTKLDAYARSVLNLRKNPRLIPQLTLDVGGMNPFEGDVGYGWLINTIIDDGWVQFNGTMRCSGYQLTLGKHGNETFVLYINDTREIEDTSS